MTELPNARAPEARATAGAARRGPDKGKVSGFATLRNGKSLSLDAIPALELSEFRRAIIAAPERRRRVSSLFGSPGRRPTGALRGARRRSDGTLEVASSVVEGERSRR